jgi:two-component system OmpR family response regulator
MQKILVVDDDRHIRDVLRFALENAGYSTCMAADGRAALEAHTTHAPDLVVLDVLMAEIDGLQVCRRLRAISHVPIVFLSSRDEEVDRIVGLEMGADDYIVKPFSPRELVARVRANLRRSEQSTVDTVHRVDHLVVNTQTFEARWDDVPLTLTQTEFMLLKTFAANPDRVFTRDALMRGAYDVNRIVSHRTIDSHIRRLRDKLKQAGAPGLKTVHGVGYRLVRQ